MGASKSKIDLSLLPQTVIAAKAFSLLGFAQKANQIVSGDDSVFIALTKSKVWLVIVAEDLSENSKQKFLQKLHSAEKTGKNANRQILYEVLGTKAQLGLAIGKSPRGLVAVLDEQFAKGLQVYLKELDGNKGVV